MCKRYCRRMIVKIRSRGQERAYGSVTTIRSSSEVASRGEGGGRVVQGEGSREPLQDVGKGDRSGCDEGLRLRTNAEISVMTSPIGKGSINVSTALKSGFLYSSLYFATSSSRAWTAASLAPEALSFSTK